MIAIDQIFSFFLFFLFSKNEMKKKKESFLSKVFRFCIYEYS